MDLLTSLASLSPSDREAFYEQRSACRAVLQLLDPLAQQFVMRMCLLDEAVPVTLVKNWTAATQQAAAQNKETLERLERLSLLKTVDGASVMLLPAFAAGVRHLMTGEQTVTSAAAEGAGGESSVSPSELRAHAEQRWKGILHVLVGTTGGGDEKIYFPEDAVIELLLEAGLMALGDDDEFKLTTEGFQFLLQDFPEQAWTLVQAYVARESDAAHLLRVVVSLAFMPTGERQPTAQFDEPQLRLLQLLAACGLVMLGDVAAGGGNARKRAKSSKETAVAPADAKVGEWFLPTPLCASLMTEARMASAGSAGDCSEEASGYIIVETNFRVYAYTSDSLHVAILSMFLSVQMLLPNLCVGVITRESVRSALVRGVRAAQIVAYLKKHVHPSVRALHEKHRAAERRDGDGDGGEQAPRAMSTRYVPLVPVAIEEQIVLWEKERNRVTAERAVLHSKFLGHNDFARIEAHARSLGSLLWSCPEKQMLAVTYDGDDALCEYIRQSRAQHADEGRALFALQQ